MKTAWRIPSRGDVIVIEQQISGPNNGAYVPAEWYKPTFDAIKIAAVTRVVVEAAGNGSQNLDSPIYSMDNGGHFPFRAAAPYKLHNDSGAILVGAGRSPIWGVQARSAEYASNYGFRVDLQGWGDSVVTTGYGNLYNSDGPNWFYAFDFSDTSSATAIVAGAVPVFRAVVELFTVNPCYRQRSSKSLLIPAPRKPVRPHRTLA